ncbi:MAG: hypothetical protein H6773_00500 [Pseudomonadales bacterium]|nr:hypothetical protein [Pseudomonadales bacterium]
MIESTPHSNENARSYAQRVTTQYKRISRLLGEQKANFFNEFIRGTSLLDPTEMGFLSQVEQLLDSDLEEIINTTEKDYHRFIEQFNANSVYNAFEKIAEGGRTKIYIWRDGKYKLVNVNEKLEKELPWAGEIKVGGPDQAIRGIVGIAKNYDIRLGNNSVEINGHEIK